VVGIIVYDHPELLPNAGAVIAQQSDPTGVTVAPGFIVDAKGEIFFPYIGRTKVQGLTESGASELVASRIKTFVKDPQVS
ncbi:sugar transporter, partial [Pseudomonas sp. BGM005]|nr:sugar transporter [Pseudomonas sp. BG5]